MLTIVNLGCVMVNVIVGIALKHLRDPLDFIIYV